MAFLTTTGEGERPNDDACYAAVSARDARFDGKFFTAVASTGIYCRPICPARLPKRSNCRFFSSAAAAEQAGFRACLRCRPEAAPGCAASRGSAATVGRACRLIEEGALDVGTSSELAERLGIGPRHLRRLFLQQLGATPLAVAATRRLLLANRLLRDSTLPISAVAFSSGFRSVRRFNAAFRERYGASPSAIRRRDPSGHGVSVDLHLRLGFRPPYDWSLMLDFLRPRLIPGVEAIHGAIYHRTLHTPKGSAWLEVQAELPRNRLRVRICSATPFPLAPLVACVRRQFDVHADPSAIEAHLRGDSALASLVRARPGVRLPGAFDAFELCVRAVLGQQVSVKGATTIAGRLVQRFGTRLPDTPKGRPGFLFPAATTLAEVGASELSKIGLPSARAETIIRVSEAVAEGLLDFTDPDRVAQLSNFRALKGIGPWTTSYVALRVFSDPDAFPIGDLGLQKAAARLGVEQETTMLDPHALRECAEPWRPWRGYAAMHLWHSLAS